MALTKGNPSWTNGKVAEIRPASMPTEFENVARSLQLDQKGYVKSQQLREWCRSNKNRCYVPEWPLEEWEMQVNAEHFDAGGSYREHC